MIEPRSPASRLWALTRQTADGLALLDYGAIVGSACIYAQMAFMLPGKYTFLVAGLYLFFGWISRALFRRRLRLWVFLLPTAAYCLTALADGLQYHVVRADLINIGVAVAVAAPLGISRMAPAVRSIFFTRFHETIASLGIFAALLGLAKFQLLSTTGYRIPFFIYNDGLYPWGAALSGDYNEFALALVVSFGSTLWLLPREHRLGWRYWYHIGLVIIPVAVLLSGSRRGVLFITVGALFFAVPRLLRWLRRSTPLPQRRNSLKPVLLAYSILAFVTVLNLDAIASLVTQLGERQEYIMAVDRVSEITSDALFESRQHYFPESIALLSKKSELGLLFGSGFDYLPYFGAKDGEDYPHNFLLSSMLYGGIFQTLLVLILIWAALLSCLRGGTHGTILLYWLTFCVAFALISSNSLFSSKMHLLTLLIALDLPRHQRPQVPYSLLQQPTSHIR